MPTILRLRLIPQDDVHLRLSNGPAQGWFLALAQRWDPAWADALHSPETTPPAQARPRHPYALVPLHHAARAPLADEDTLNGSQLVSGRLRHGEPLAVRISLADDERARRLLDALPHLSLPRLGTAPCRLARIPCPVDTDPDWLHASWAMLADAPPAERLLIRFETPTMFSRAGESLVLPEPERLLDSWRQAWCCAPALPEGAAGLTAEGLRITQYDLHTEPMSLKGGLRIGFVGELELTWKPGTPPQTRRALTALAGLADFLGTGAKTAMGMGQTRVRVIDSE